MAKRPRPAILEIAPSCSTCGPGAMRLTNGSEIYPHRPDLHSKPIWICHACRSYVGCHPGTQIPLGTAADAQLRDARMKLHNQMIDPLWKAAERSGGYDLGSGASVNAIRQKARTRVYEFMADRMGLTRDQCHTGMFDIDMCRTAWRALQGVTYAEIRDWAKTRKEAA